MFTMPNIRHILGWLTYAEAAALQQCTFTVSGLPGDIVEVGSYCGRSTIAIADALKQGCTGHLYAVDDHETTMALYGVDSYSELLRNISKYEVQEYVTTMKMSSKQAAEVWKGSIKMLFIDADHEYDAVLQDYELWHGFMVHAGMLVFHDYMDDGPMKVIEQLSVKQWQVYAQIDRLAVFKYDAHAC